jgi:hypothetical protein
MRFAAAMVCALVVACGPSGHGAGGGGGGGGVDDDKVRGGEWDPKLIEEMLGALRKEVGCPSATSKYRLWCLATEGWAKGEAGALPARGLYVGLSLSLAEGDPVDDWLENGVTFSALGVRTVDGKPMARIAELAPKNKDAAELVGPAMKSVSQVFQAEKTEVVLSKEMHDYLHDLPEAADYEMRKDAQGWRWKSVSESELRQAGPYWLAVEIPPEGARGVIISIFTDKIAK